MSNEQLLQMIQEVEQEHNNLLAAGRAAAPARVRRNQNDIFFLLAQGRAKFEELKYLHQRRNY